MDVNIYHKSEKSDCYNIIKFVILKFRDIFSMLCIKEEAVITIDVNCNFVGFPCIKITVI